MKPIFHARSSAKRFGGEPEDYLPIHDFMDSSKGAIADHRHRTLTHNSWFLSTVLERVFGHMITNSNGREVSVREIGEQHVMEDFRGFIPTAQDYLQSMDIQPWMDNGKDFPPSWPHRRKKNVAGNVSSEVRTTQHASQGSESLVQSSVCGGG